MSKETQQVTLNVYKKFVEVHVKHNAIHKRLRILQTTHRVSKRVKKKRT